MTKAEERGTGAVLFRFLLVGIAVVILFKAGLLLVGLMIGGTLAFLGIGVAVVVGVGMLAVVLSVMALPFILLGWLASAVWRALFRAPGHA